MIRAILHAAAAMALVGLSFGLGSSAARAQAPDNDIFTLELCDVEGADRQLMCGVYAVYEDRDAQSGRQLPLRVVLIPARSPEKDAEPIIVLPGGPGVAATRRAAQLASSWESEYHDVLLVDHRGTGDGHRLDCRLVGSDEDLQGYFSPPFAVDLRYDGCRDRLSADFDLRHYSTFAAMSDLDEVRNALGFDRVHLVAQSYGTRNAMAYINFFGDHVVGALFNGPAPLANRTPLYHAAGAQEAFDALVAACQADHGCNTAYPTLAETPGTIIERLEEAPVSVAVAHPVSGASEEVQLSADNFAEAMRMMMYNSRRSGRLPYLLGRALEGDFAPFANLALAANRGVRSQLAFGLLLSVTCSEDVDRIGAADIAAATDGTYLGATRVNGQIAACEGWPRSGIPAQYFAPAQSDVPVVILSGDLDPVTPPHWGTETARLFPNSLHLTIPGGHGQIGECVIGIVRQTFAANGLHGVDASCTEELPGHEFALPGDADA